MRTLYLLRHAKSSWDDPDLRDSDRPLAPRGRKAVRRIAGHVEHSEIRPGLVLCSPARRARETLDGLAPALARPETVFDERLYGASEDELLSRVREVPDGVGSVLLVGHNPGIGRLLELLTGRGLPVPDDVPTGALATLTFAAASWREIGPGEGTLAAYVVPRQLG